MGQVVLAVITSSGRGEGGPVVVAVITLSLYLQKEGRGGQVVIVVIFSSGRGEGAK